MQLFNFEDMRSSITWPLFPDIDLIFPRFFTVSLFSLVFSFIFVLYILCFLSIYAAFRFAREMSFVK
jgi:hypothetical protein